MWVYGSGFPKSLDLSKAIDKAAGAEREVVERMRWDNKSTGFASSTFASSPNFKRSDEPATPAAHTWQGYGTALKPALEPIVLAQKPREGSFVDNVLTHGCGALNVDGCRIEAARSIIGHTNQPTMIGVYTLHKARFNRPMRRADDGPQIC